MPLMVRLSPEQLLAVDNWRRQQPDLPNRTEAIRRLVDLALAKALTKPAPDPRARAAAATYAEKAAGEQIDRSLKDTGQPDDVKAERKKRLTKVPAELTKPRR
jgi:hypothetical protein